MIAYDLETTGLNVHQCSIIEIGALRLINGNIVKRFQLLVIPRVAIESDAQEIHGISNQEIQRHGVSAEIAPRDFLGFIGSAPILAQQPWRRH
jgi:DNA polymerase III epsilon subunit-like protein